MTSSPAWSTSAEVADSILSVAGEGARRWCSNRPLGTPLTSGAELDRGRAQTAVLPAVAEFTRVCAYDRPGTQLTSGDASPEPQRPRRSASTVSEIVADLHALLDAADVPGPYVLVGHSLGGLLARMYAGTYPDEVAGFVSVDAGDELYYESYQELLPPACIRRPAPRSTCSPPPLRCAGRGPKCRFIRCRWSCSSIPGTEYGFRTLWASRRGFPSNS